MTNEMYTIGGNLNTIVKYNIDFDRIQILNYTCANYIKEILNDADTFDISEEDKEKLSLVMNKLLK